MLLFLYVPFAENIKNSFYNMTSIIALPGTEWKVQGAANYRKLFEDPMIKTAILNTLKMMVLTVVFQVGIAFVLAVMVSNVKKFQQLFRTVYFFPIVISATAIGLLFNLFYTYNGGMLNQVLEMFGKDPVLWMEEGRAFTMIAIPTIWSYVGFYFVIMLTGLSDISDDIYEAADIDGCNKLKQVFYITIPMVKPVFATCVTLAITGAIKVFDLPWVIAMRGAPYGTTHFLGTYMYQVTFESGDWDYGSTLSLLIVVMGVLVSWIVGFFTKERD